MDTYVLATKLGIPPQTHRMVHRNRLVDALERGIPAYKLVMISAPAGYGKTTLLSQWARSSRFPVAWLSISAEDNNPERFFRYLLTAWEQIQPGVSGSPLGLLLGTMLPDSESILSAFINVANDVPDHMVFVLDDYHLIEEPAIHQALTFLLDHLPSTLHFVLAGRGEPPLPLARYRARQELLEFHTDDLQFLIEETGDFLNQSLDLHLAYDEIVPLHAQLEGWIAGLQLVALTLQRRPEAADTLVVSGRHRFIADYLSEDVLAHLLEDTRRFLLQTSILDRLCDSLCNAVTGREDGQAMLETLERENLFLAPLDYHRDWFRYHGLFADFLHEELWRRHPDDVTGLHRRAARWYLEHDLPEQAFDHAIQGNDLDLMIRIGERYLFMKLHNGEFSVLQRWLAALPEEWIAAYPTFRLAEAGLLAYSGAVDACVRCVDEVEHMMAVAEMEDPRPQMARVTALRCFVACFQNDVEHAEIYADQALRNLAQEDIAFRADIYHALGDTYRRNGRWEESKESYLQVLNFTRSPTFRSLSAHVFGALADLELRQGRLAGSEAYWQQALDAIQQRESWGIFPLPVIGWVYIRMSEILYQRNKLMDARDYLSRGLEYAELGGDARSMIAGYLIAGQIQLTQGSTDVADDYLERARPLVGQASLPDWISRFERFQLELWLAQDRLRAAVRWSDEMLQSDALDGRPDSEVARLAMARVLIVKGDMPAVERALSLLEHLLRSAEAEGRTGIAIEALALESLAHWKCGEPATAMTSLERALRLAEPEGYVRLFADLGLPMVRLLQEARSREIMPDYVATLLAACGAGLTIPLSVEGGLPEPLTEREQEILELVAAGLTNREIGDRLFVSPQTVKKHTGNIYGKLGAHSRTEAVARARELDLLG